MKKIRSANHGLWAVYAAAALAAAAALGLCFSMVQTIDRRMDESAAANLLNTTRVIEDTLEGLIGKDFEALDVVGELSLRDEPMSPGQISTMCDTLGFEWVGVADAHGNGVDGYANRFHTSQIPACDQWIPGAKGYSDAYVGQRSGRPQIMLWVPVWQGEEYAGTVFGSVILTKYYSANVFTFYEGAGRTYLFDGSNGEWILKSLGTDGASVRQSDVYSLLLASGNKPADVDAFRELVQAGRPGTAAFDFGGEASYLCFLPLPSSPDWYVVTVIGKDTLLREAAEVQQMIWLVFLTFCVTVAVSAAAFILWRVRRTRAVEARYRETLFANLSSNLDSAFLIRSKDGGKTAFVSDNVQRLLGLERDRLAQDAGRLFDWCGMPPGDALREAFLGGTLEQAAVREVCVESGAGIDPRCIRLELIPGDLGQQIAVLTDVTKEKDIQRSLLDAMQRAEAASNAKNEFLSAMSHDIRTPINGVVGMTTIAAAHLDDPDRVKDCLSKISEATAHLLDLINEVLDMSQIESGRMELCREPFNLPELLQNVLTVNFAGLQQRGQAVNVHLCLLEHEEVIGDPGRLSRVVSNLLSNAIKYTPEGGAITLELREKPAALQGYGRYELLVQDNGIGMSAEFQKKLFEPFEREEDVRISRIPGTGLGMSIVKNIVSLMMGDIQVQSEKGRGSTFRVTFHLQLDQQNTRPSPQLKDLPVLVVDDDRITCEAVTNILCDIGMDGEWTDSGEQAVRRVAARRGAGADYRAVLLDWKMPGMDGVETARRIRAQVGAHLPIIILTAYDWREIETEARAAGVDTFLSKPLYKAKLLQKMTELVAGEPKPAETPPSAPCPPASFAGKRVLVAEDNELNTEIALELLQMLGLGADCAPDGAAAVEAFAASAPGTYSLILMDIQMPRMNGYQATRAIRGMERPDSGTIPIVAMTADAFKRDEQSALAAGMDAHLSKPVSVERLAQVLAQFLQQPAPQAGGKEMGDETNR